MKGELRLMSRIEGDMTVHWDKDNEKEISAARKMFDEMKAKGYAFYKLKIGGRKGEIIHRFDPTAERIIGTLPIVGGNLPRINAGELRYEIYRDKGGQFRWRCRSPNGQIVAQSEGYKRKKSAVDCAVLLAECESTCYDLTVNEGDQRLW